MFSFSILYTPLSFCVCVSVYVWVNIHAAHYFVVLLWSRYWLCDWTTRGHVSELQLIESVVTVM